MVFIPLKRSFDTLSVEIRQRQQINRTERVATETWEKSFAATRAGGARSYIDFLDVSERDGILAVTVRAFISESILPEERESYTRAIATALGRRPETIQVAIVEIPTSTYQVAKAKKEAEATPTQVAERAGRRFHRAAQEVLAHLGASRLPAGAILLDRTLAIGSGPPTATIVYLAPAPISDDARSLIAAAAREQLDLPTLETHLVHIPATTGIAFERRVAAMSDASAPSIETLAATLRPRHNLRVILQTASDDGLDARRAGVARDALIAAGVEEARIATATAENVPNDQVIVLIEKTPTASPPQTKP
jgi:hypothetical protein